MRGVHHLKVRHHFIRDAVESKGAILHHVDTEKLPADLLTKPLSEVQMFKTT